MRWKSIIVSVIIAVVVIVWMAGGNLGNKAVRQAAIDQEAETSAQNDRELEAFLVKAKLSKASLFSSQVHLSGRTRALRRSNLKSETTASVKAVLVSDGDRVQAGDLLVELTEGTRQSAYDSALAAMERAKKNLEAITNLSSSGYQSELELLQAKEAMARAQQSVNQAKDALDDTQIVAPFDGVLLDVAVEVGDFVSPGALITSLIDLNPIELVSHISEREYANIALGQAAKAKLISGTSHEGLISYISTSSNVRTGTFEVRIQLDNPDMRIPEGMSADVVIFTSKVPTHFQPKSVLSLSEAGEVGVKAVSTDGTVVFYPVDIIDDTEDGVHLGGLPAEMLLIYSGQDFVRHGTRVRVDSVE